MSPRVLAHRILNNILDKRQDLDRQLVLPELDALESRDRAFVRVLVTATLRHLAGLDAALNTFLQHPEKAEKVRNILRLGAAQVLVLDTDPHAAVNETVELAKGVQDGRLSGLVNAVMRRMSEQKKCLQTSVKQSHSLPDWLRTRWEKAYGAEAALAMAQGHLDEPPLDLTVKDDPHHWAERLGGTVLPTGSVRVTAGGRINELDGYDEGAWWVQDAAAALPVTCLGDLTGQTVLDLCAAPGGKTAQLVRAGAHVTALDRSANRLKRLQQNISRLGYGVEVVTEDAQNYRPDQPVDGVLLDAPCSATGTLRRRPDIPWIRGENDIAKLTQLQARLSDAAVAMLKPGGWLLYCTCSLEPEEGEGQVDQFLHRHPDVHRAPFPAIPDGISAFFTAAGDIRTRPSQWCDQGRLDGFYAAYMIKTP